MASVAAAEPIVEGTGRAFENAEVLVSEHVTVFAHSTRIAHCAVSAVVGAVVANGVIIQRATRIGVRLCGTRGTGGARGVVQASTHSAGKFAVVASVTNIDLGVCGCRAGVANPLEISFRGAA